MRFAGAIILLVSFWTSAAAPALAQSALDDSVNAATKVLHEIMAVPLKCIPGSLLREAQGIAIVPGLVKGGFIIGAEHGKGVLITRDEAGLWRAPVFVSVTGSSIGVQAGVEKTDLVLVLKTQRSVERILKGKVTIGTDLAVAAGPLGRDASAGTEGRPLKADVLSYSRSRGLFAGVAINGAAMVVDYRANTDYYAVPPGHPHGSIPRSAVALVQEVTTYAPPPQGAIRPVVVGVLPKETPAPPLLAAPAECEVARQQLVAAGHRLQPVLEPAWQQYLALPPEVITGQTLAPGVTLEPVLRRYQMVAGDARYRALTEHPEFQETYAQLRRYAALAQPRPGTLALPPPPAH